MSSSSSSEPPQDAQVAALQRSVGIVINNTMSNVHQIAELVASSGVYKEQYQYLTSRLSAIARILTGKPLCGHCVSDKKDLIESDPLSVVSDIVTTLSTQLVVLTKKVVPSLNESVSKFANSEIKAFAKTLINIGESLLLQAAVPIETNPVKCDCTEILSEMSQEERKSMHCSHNPACNNKACKWSSPPADEEEPRPDFETRSIVKQEEDEDVTCIECGDDIPYCFMNMRYCDPICLAASYEKDVLKVMEGAKVSRGTAVKMLHEQHGIVQFALNVLNSKPRCIECGDTNNQPDGIEICGVHCKRINAIRNTIDNVVSHEQAVIALDHCNGDVKQAIEYLNSKIAFGATICYRCKKEDCDSDSDCNTKYEDDVNTVRKQANVDRPTAEKALYDSKGNVPNAILSLSE